MTVSALGTAAIVLVLAWTLGGVALRLAGGLVLWVGLLGLAVTGDADGLLVGIVGALAWLAGHWHYALRHGAYKSPLAGRLFGRWAPAWLDPGRHREG